LGYALFIGGADFARDISVSYCNIELKQTEILSASRKVHIPGAQPMRCDSHCWVSPYDLLGPIVVPKAVYITIF